MAKSMWTAFMYRVTYDALVTYVPLLSLIAALVFGGLGLYYFVANRRRTELRYDFKAEPALKTTRSSRIEIDGSHVVEPYEVTLFLLPSGFKDIKSQDFDADQPLILELSTPLVTQPDASTKEFGVSGKPGEQQIVVRPQVLECGKLLYGTAIVDGKPDLAVSGKIADVAKVRFAVADAGKAGARSKAARWAATVALGALTAVSGYSYYISQQSAELAQTTYERVLKDSADSYRRLAELSYECLNPPLLPSALPGAASPQP